MKKYLIRSGFDPTKRIDPKNYVFKDFVGANSGNMFTESNAFANCIQAQ